MYTVTQLFSLSLGPCVSALCLAAILLFFKGVCGTQRYMAPEMKAKQPYDTSVDWYLAPPPAHISSPPTHTLSPTPSYPPLFNLLTSLPPYPPLLSTPAPLPQPDPT